MKQTRRISFQELILKEARQIASARLEAELDEQNLPLPKDSALEIHLDALIAADPTIMVEAEKRVEAKADAYSTALSKLGLDLEIARAVDIDLN